MVGMLPIAGVCLLLFVAQGAPDPCAAASEAYSTGDLSGAAGYLERCVDAHPSDLAWHVRLCAVYQLLGRDQELYQAAKRGMERFPAERRFYLTAGILAAKTGDVEAAVRYFGSAADRWPEDSTIRQNLAQALMLRGTSRLDAGDNVGAEEDLSRVVALDSSNCDALMNLGRVLYNLQRSAESLEVFDRIQDLRPDYPGVELHRGVVLVTMGRNDEALEALNRHLAREDSQEGRYFRGLALKGLGDFEQARGDLEKATGPGSINPDAFYEKGGCLEKLSRNEEAEAAYRRAIELDSTRPKYSLALGQLLMREGRREEGLAIMKQARSLYAGMVQQDQRRLMFKSVSSAAPEKD